MNTLILSILFSLSCITQANGGQKYDKDYIKNLIVSEAVSQGFPADLAISVATVESGLNPNARGSKGEVGLFQILPRQQLYTHKDIRTIRGNISEGIKQLTYWKSRCPVKENYTFVTCYNQGNRHPKFPRLHPYYLKVMQAM